jgi:hypothetical protein
MWRIYFKAIEALWWFIVVCFCAPMLQIQFWKLLIIPVCYELLNAGMLGIVKVMLLKFMGREKYFQFQLEINENVFKANMEDVGKEIQKEAE